jgi:hypothetical protein
MVKNRRRPSTINYWSLIQHHTFGRHFSSFVPHSRNYGGQAGRSWGVAPPRAKALGYSVRPFHGQELASALKSFALEHAPPVNPTLNPEEPSVISDDVPGFVLWTSELITDTLITDYFRATPIGARITFNFSPRARAALASISCSRQRQRM